MNIVLKGGTIVNPVSSVVEQADILIQDGIVAAIEPEIDVSGRSVVDAAGLLICPGLVDIHVHFRDPGFPEKETIRSGAMAAAAGGFTAVVCMPNTKPAVDTPETLEYVLNTAKKEAAVHVYSSAAITYGLEGKALTDLERLQQSGAVTFTDDGKTVMDPNLLYEAFAAAAKLGVPISSHCEDHHFVLGGSINKGEISEHLGDPGIHPLAEETIIARDILFAEETGAALHIQHVTTARGAQLIREAKRRGVRVTGEAAPHHFSITDRAVLEAGTMAKVNPPLRTAKDVEAIIEALQDGTLDAIATDHAPHTLEEKSRPMGQAPFGMLGLETAVGLVFTNLVHTGKLSVLEAIRKMTIVPSGIMNLPHGRLAVGGPADLALIDPNLEWVVDSAKFHSRSVNTPFEGMSLKGKTVMTMVGGAIVYQLGETI